MGKEQNRKDHDENKSFADDTECTSVTDAFEATMSSPGFKHLISALALSAIDEQKENEATKASLKCVIALIKQTKEVLESTDDICTREWAIGNLRQLEEKKVEYETLQHEYYLNVYHQQYLDGDRLALLKTIKNSDNLPEWATAELKKAAYEYLQSFGKKSIDELLGLKGVQGKGNRPVSQYKKTAAELMSAGCIRWLTDVFGFSLKLAYEITAEAKPPCIGFKKQTLEKYYFKHKDISQKVMEQYYLCFFLIDTLENFQTLYGNAWNKLIAKKYSMDRLKARDEMTKEELNWIKSMDNVSDHLEQLIEKTRKEARPKNNNVYESITIVIR